MKQVIPKPPLALTLEEKRHYSSIAKYLISQKSFKKVDAYLIAQAARAWVRYEEMERMVEKEGAVQIFSTGASNVSGWYAAMQKERDHFLKLADKLGMNAAARDKISTFKADAKEGGGIIARMQKIREQKAKRI